MKDFFKVNFDDEENHSKSLKNTNNVEAPAAKTAYTINIQNASDSNK